MKSLRCCWVAAGFTLTLTGCSGSLGGETEDVDPPAGPSSTASGDGETTSGAGAGKPATTSATSGAGEGAGDATSGVGGSSSSSGSGGADAPADAYFPAGSWFYQDISNAPVASDSSTVTHWLENNGGWGTGTMRIDFSIEVLKADASTPFETFQTTGDFFSPDCDHVPMPVPAGGALEGEDGYECQNDGDCHLIVRDDAGRRLYEMWRANITGGTFYGGCLAAWDMTRLYGPEGRGEQCTSSDGAGFPVAPLLFTADEVAAGEIKHAIRFILPNARMRDGVYVRPATHAGAPSGPNQAPVYGSRWRLRADYPVDSLPSQGAKVVANAMKKYGMALADGGNIALTAQSDRSTTAKWSDYMDTYDLSDLQPTDFEVIDTGSPIPLTYDCVRTPY